MANRNFREGESRIKVTVDGKQGINELSLLEQRARELTDDIKGLKKGTADYVEQNKRLKEVRAQISQTREALGLQGMTLRQLASLQRELRREITTTATRGTAEYKKLEKEYQEVTRAIMHQRREMNSLNGTIDKGILLGQRFAGALLPLIGITGGIAAFTSLIGVSAQFEQEMSNLSAITGAVGDDLTRLSDEARRVGENSTLSATQAAEAFTLIASKKPELLDNIDALVATTEATVTLAEAAGITLPEAADATATLLNQFGESADQASRVVNVLAAGSKFGAGNIEFLNDSVRRFGPVAKAMGVSIEESVGHMESFAKGGLDSSTAGTNFRNILLILGKESDELNPKVVGLSTAIENLGKKNLSTAEMTKMFGRENVVAAQIMLDLAQETEEMIQKVTDSSVAMEQARVRTDNFKGAMASLKSVTEEIIISGGSVVLKFLTPFVRTLTAALRVAKEAPEFFRQNKDVIQALGIAVVTLNSGMIISNALILKEIALRKLQAIWTGTVTTAQNLLNAAMTANPIGLLIKGVGLLIGGFVILYNRSEKVRGTIAGVGAAMQEMWQITKETFSSLGSGLQKLFTGDVRGAMRDFAKMVTEESPVEKLRRLGERVGAAYTDGYKKKLASEKEEVLAAKAAMAEGGVTLSEEAFNELSTEEQERFVNHLGELSKEYEKFQEKLAKIREEFYLKSLTEDEREMEKVQSKYRALEDELLTHLENKLISQQEYEERLAEIQGFRDTEVRELEESFAQRDLEERMQAMQKIREATADERELALEKTEEYYSELLALADRFGLDTTDIEAVRIQALRELQAKWHAEDVAAEQAKYEEKLKIVRAFAQGAMGVAGLISAFSADNANFEKVMAVGRASIASGEAIANMVRNFSSTSLTPIQLAASVASGVGIIASNIANAVRVVNRASIPEPPEVPSLDQATRGNRNRSNPVRSFFFGGATGEGMGIGDRFGEFAGFVHQNEYVVPQMIMSDPRVANVLPLIESIRKDKIRGFATGGDTGPSSTPAAQAADMEPVLAELRAIRSMLSSMPKEIRAYLSYSDLKNITDEIEDLEDRFTA